MKTVILLLTALSLRAGGIERGGTANHGPGLTVHEWGTFTSVQAADGVQMGWNPLQVSELPKFVYDLNRPTADSKRQRYQTFAGKTALFALQRMETPVIYFYSETNVQVDLRVDFPRGIITEWYPQAAEIGRLVKRAENEKVQSYLAWKELEVLAGGSPGTTQELPRDATSSHYYQARGAEANLLRAGHGEKSELEKFLFYRGVGSFEAPLKVSLNGSKNVQMENRGTAELRNLFVFQLHNGQGSFAEVDRLAAGEVKSVSLEGQEWIAKSELQDKLAARMQIGLEKEGLFAAEARAMTETWRDSWFGEDGVRVLYTLPQDWTERELPLAITPTPRSVTRVMVGRAEVITPEMEAALFQQLVRFSTAKENEVAEVVRATRALHLGRFAEPTMRRVVLKNENPEFSRKAWTLLEAITKPEKETVALR